MSLRGVGWVQGGAQARGKDKVGHSVVEAPTADSFR